jgi:hypothetical protein
LISRLTAGLSGYRTSSSIFLRCLAAVYFIAFLSLWTQLPGLIGRNGMLPAHYFLRVARERLGVEAYFLLPTLGWFNSSDVFWQFLCLSGALLSLIPLAGIFSGLTFFLMWVFYLSLVTVGRDFLAFQWDGLLLEAGFLAIFLARPQLLPKRSAKVDPAALVILLFWWLLFRLMFSSGAVKLLSGDPAWSNLTALTYHYETQPLPNVVSWFAHQLSPRVQQSSVAGMLVVELVVPFLIFAPLRLRWLGCASLVLLQLVISATGNYAFFNLLTMALCVLLLDDEAWHRLRLLRAGPVATGRAVKPGQAEPAEGKGWPNWIILPFAPVMLLLTSAAFSDTLGWRVPWPSPAAWLVRWASPLCIANRYGLFAVMTTERPEIILEGSLDGENWQAYEFKYKPGDLARRPPFVAPHQPRLDWQMWFAALGHYQQNPWYGSLCNRLLQGRTEVLKLMDKNPFPLHPPRFVRGVWYDYDFTNAEERRATGRWWRRELRGLYSPVMSLPQESR